MPVLRYSSACKMMFRCRFLALVDVHTIYRYHGKNALPVKWCLKGRIALQAGHASPVKWCLNEKVELLCKVVFERKGFAWEMVSNCNVGALTI